MHIRIRADGFDGVIRMVAHGAGIAIVPKAAIARRPPEPSWQWVSLQEAWAQRSLRLCARRFDNLPAYAKAHLLGVAVVKSTDGVAYAKAKVASLLLVGLCTKPYRHYKGC